MMFDELLERLSESTGIGMNVQSEENNQLIVEMAILDECSTVQETVNILSESSEYGASLAAHCLNEKSIVRLDKEAKLSKATQMAIFTIAREKGDSDFKKLITLWKAESVLKQKLNRKYLGQAKMRAKEMVKAAKKKMPNVFKKTTA